MSDAITVTPAPEMAPEVKEQIKKLENDTKRGFDLKARLKNRGLRKATVTLYLDEEKGVELGWAYDRTNEFGNVTSRVRGGVIGELDALAEEREAFLAASAAESALTEKPADKPDEIDKKIAELEKRRDELVAELTETGIVVKMKAVPSIIQKDMRRRARDTMGITEKGIPADLKEEFNLCAAAHLMTQMFLSVTDNQTGAVNEETTYDDAMDLIGYLPPGQWERLDEAMGTVQYTDAISRTIEGQEDFS